MRAKREAAVAGACGALGGLCAKMALDAGPTAALVDSGVSAVLLRVLAGFAALAFNLHMTASQSRALDASPSSLQPTLIATASNFLLTGAVGYFALGEATGLLWWSGIALIVLGLGLVAR